MDPITIGLALASQFAPAIIKYFTNSDTAGAVAGQVIDIAKTVTGKGTPDEATAALQADPALAMQFKTAVMAHDLELAKLGLQETQVFVADTADARAKHAGDRGVFWLGIAVLATFAVTMSGCLYGAYQILTGGITIKDVAAVAAVSGFVGSIVGYIAANAQQVIGYFFGSSKGSTDKGNAMADAVKGLGQIKR